MLRQATIRPAARGRPSSFGPLPCLLRSMPGEDMVCALRRGRGCWGRSQANQIAGTELEKLLARGSAAKTALAKIRSRQDSQCESAQARLPEAFCCARSKGAFAHSADEYTPGTNKQSRFFWGSRADFCAIRWRSHNHAHNPCWALSMAGWWPRDPLLEDRPHRALVVA